MTIQRAQTSLLDSAVPGGSSNSSSHQHRGSCMWAPPPYFACCCVLGHTHPVPWPLRCAASELAAGLDMLAVLTGCL